MLLLIAVTVRAGLSLGPRSFIVRADVATLAFLMRHQTV
jgi:hypothetical protein